MATPVIPDEFQDDGCTGAPDHLFGRSLRFACRLHDFYYCTRGWPAGALTQDHRHYADRMLGELVRSTLPFGTRWVGWLYYRMVYKYGGDEAFDSCGPTVGERCRHNLQRPGWMT